MADVTLGHIIDICSGWLQDESSDEDERHWTETRLVEHYNTVQRRIVSMAPDAYVVREAILLASGSQQTIPANGIVLIDIIRNMGTDGETPGEAVTLASLQAVQAFDRNWSTETAAEVILNYMPDSIDKQAFWTYPPSDGTGYVLAEFSKVPDQVVWDEDGDWEYEIVIVDNKYVDALMFGIMERAYMKDSDYPGNAEREAHYGAKFTEAMNI